ncbi:MAG: hypothetical protein ACXWPM_02075 [Bdellovibrionota bacterium]
MSSPQRISRSALKLLVVTTAFEAMRMGASVFRALIDLPARHRIGSVAFAEFSRATDLSATGFAFYIAYGIGGALLTGAMWVVSIRTRAPFFVQRLAAVSAICSLLILVLTTQGAPYMLRVGSSPNDPVLLDQLFEGFEFWSYPRLALACLSFGAIFAALVRLASFSTRQGRQE